MKLNDLIPVLKRENPANIDTKYYNAHPVPITIKVFDEQHPDGDTHIAANAAEFDGKREIECMWAEVASGAPGDLYAQICVKYKPEHEAEPEPPAADGQPYFLS